MPKTVCRGIGIRATDKDRHNVNAKSRDRASFVNGNSSELVH